MLFIALTWLLKLTVCSKYQAANSNKQISKTQQETTTKNNNKKQRQSQQQQQQQNKQTNERVQQRIPTKLDQSSEGIPSTTSIQTATPADNPAFLETVRRVRVKDSLQVRRWISGPLRVDPCPLSTVHGHPPRSACPLEIRPLLKA